MSLGDLRVIGRGSAGVRLFNVADNEHVVSAARIEESEDEADVNLGDGTVAGEPTPDGSTGEDLAAGPEDGQ
jgi:DNA gyrase subunit A